MSTYQFYLESCQIMDTRSFHEDTIIAGVGAIVNGVPLPSLAVQVGDHNNGSFAFWEKGLGSMDNVAIGTNDFFAFAFELFNNGHSHQPSVSDLQAFVDRDLINAHGSFGPWFPSSQPGNKTAARTDLIVLVPGGDWNPDKQDHQDLIESESDLYTGGIFSGLKAAIGGCDGPLGAGLIYGQGAALEQRIPAIGPLRISAQLNAKNLGFDAPCNRAGSNYVVNIIVQRRS